MLHLAICSYDEVCVRGGQAAITEFFVVLTWFVWSLSLSLSLLLRIIFGSTPGFTILRNVHVLWVRAPLSRQTTVLLLFLSVPETTRPTHLPVSHPVGVFRFTSPGPITDAPPSCCAFNAYSPASAFSHVGQDGFLSFRFFSFSLPPFILFFSLSLLSSLFSLLSSLFVAASFAPVCFLTHGQRRRQRTSFFSRSPVRDCDDTDDARVCLMIVTCPGRQLDVSYWISRSRAVIETSTHAATEWVSSVSPPTPSPPPPPAPERISLVKDAARNFGQGWWACLIVYV